MLLFQTFPFPVSTGPNWAEIVTALATVAIAGGLIGTARQLSDNRKDRHIEVISEYGKRWDDEPLRAAREERGNHPKDTLAPLFKNWYDGEGDHAQVLMLLRIPNYFEDLAVTAEFGDIDLTLIDKSMGDIITAEYDYWTPAIDEMRTRRPTTYREFQRLADRLTALRKELAATGEQASAEGQTESQSDQVDTSSGTV